MLLKKKLPLFLLLCTTLLAFAGLHRAVANGTTKVLADGGAPLPPIPPGLWS
jgi:hypothetical protein